MTIMQRLLIPILLTASAIASADSEPFIGEIQFVGFNFAPRGWAQCDGQLLAVSSHTALFSILGTTYGGDGRTTFALPDMRGRIPVHAGRGYGLQTRRLGERGGTETNVLTVNQIPAHTHTLNARSSTAQETLPTVNRLARTRSNLRTYESVSASNPANVQLEPESVGTAGNGEPINNMHPSLGANCIIALEGIYPSRN
jgi:microcystin-dependent protein